MAVSRQRRYFILMGICLGLFVLSWAVVRLYSTLAAVVMSAVALAIPPFAAIVGNADERDKHERGDGPGGSDGGEGYDGHEPGGPGR